MITDKDFKIWDGISYEFPKRPKPGRGFTDSASIDRALRVVAKALNQMQSGEPVADVSVFHQYPLPIVLALLDQTTPIRVLDFGGGLGQTYLAVRATRRAEGVIEFYVLEQDEIVNAGRDLFRNDERVQFITSFDEVPAVVDVVHTASAFQYVDDWQGLLKTFAALTPKFIAFGNLLAGEIEPCVTFQNYWGYKIPVRFHNYESVKNELGKFGYHVVFEGFHEHKILGRRQPLPLQHFPKKHRLVYGRNVILKHSK